ncbi:MAG: DUF4276 family protein [Patescibacteria group bacterium]|nr:DUF4276 family protein [Patescibacteria group bacterium]
MSTRIYLEGGGDSKELHARCREGFRRLLERCGFRGRMPRLVACGSRGATFQDFATAHAVIGRNHYVAMLIDSEDPVADIERPWAHLKNRDGWDQPPDADDDQVLLMTTCMETWIVSDRQTLRDHYGACLQESALPSLIDLESRARRAVQDALVRATRNCRRVYGKGAVSFEILGKLAPSVLRASLPSFVRSERILGSKL